jgi:hypothetical protein
MRRRQFIAGLTAAAGAVVALLGTQAIAQAPTASLTTLKTSWDEPDLQGIWTETLHISGRRLKSAAGRSGFLL